MNSNIDIILWCQLVYLDIYSTEFSHNHMLSLKTLLLYNSGCNRI